MTDKHILGLDLGTNSIGWAVVAENDGQKRILHAGSRILPMDAEMMGKKIIASDVDGNPEVVKNGETGLLVPAKNVKRLAEAMIYMLENKKEADEMAKNARKYYEEKFDFEKIFKEKMLPLYNIEKEEK